MQIIIQRGRPLAKDHPEEKPLVNNNLSSPPPPPFSPFSSFSFCSVTHGHPRHSVALVVVVVVVDVVVVVVDIIVVHHLEWPASCHYSSRGAGLLQIMIQRGRPLANDHPEEKPLANNHLEGPASCK